MGPCHVTNCDTCHMSNLKKGHVAVSNLRVKEHTIVSIRSSIQNFLILAGQYKYNVLALLKDMKPLETSSLPSI